MVWMGSASPKSKRGFWRIHDWTIEWEMCCAVGISRWFRTVNFCWIFWAQRTKKAQHLWQMTCYPPILPSFQQFLSKIPKFFSFQRRVCESTGRHGYCCDQSFVSTKNWRVSPLVAHRIVDATLISNGRSFRIWKLQNDYERLVQTRGAFRDLASLPTQGSFVRKIKEPSLPLPIGSRRFGVKATWKAWLCQLGVDAPWRICGSTCSFRLLKVHVLRSFATSFLQKKFVLESPK